MDSKKSIAKKMAEVMAEVGYVQKDAANQHHRYKYASADAVLTKVRAACSARGIGITHTDANVMSLDWDRPKEGWVHAVVSLTQTYTDSESGESVSYSGLASASDKGDKANMKANTGALKYLLSLAFNISWGDDPEADTSVDQATSSAPAKRPSARRQPSEEQAAPSVSDFESSIAATKSERELDAVRDSLLKVRKDLGAEAFEHLKGLVIERRNNLSNVPF